VPDVSAGQQKSINQKGADPARPVAGIQPKLIRFSGAYRGGNE
jgi:hypothetical protein